MVYQEYSQLKRYFQKPDPFLTTNAHFYDSAKEEAPNPDRRANTPGTHKRSTFAKCYPNSPLNRQLYSSDRTKSAAQTCHLSTGSSQALFPDTLRKTNPSSTYRGNGTFTVSVKQGRVGQGILKVDVCVRLELVTAGHRVTSDIGKPYKHSSSRTYLLSCQSRFEWASRLYYASFLHKICTKCTQHLFSVLSG